MRNLRRTIIYSSIATVLIIAFIVLQIPAVQAQALTIARSVKQYLEYDNVIAQAIREQLFPQTLVSSSDQQLNVLNKTQVIALTNKERQSRGLAVLAENQKLNIAAEKKLNDLFARQYFDHVSPDGHGPSWVADQAGYAYVVVGENLALGDFKDNEALVAAWMASPGHKANILNTKFVEIGVAVGRGTYEGKKVWIAVQEFGRPLSDCPVIDTALRASIEQNRNLLDTMSKNLTALKQELASMRQTTEAEQDAYNKKVAEYNSLVAEYNHLAAVVKTNIQTYNTEVQAFNACIK